jgi:hypothetical protein
MRERERYKESERESRIIRGTERKSSIVHSR